MKIAQKNTKITRGKRRRLTQPLKLLYRRSGSLQTGEKSRPMEQGNEKRSGRIVYLETLELIYMRPFGPGKRPHYL
jgi:hypothetical protein